MNYFSIPLAGQDGQDANENKTKQNKSWEKSWQKVIKYLNKSGLWQELKQEIETGLEIGIEKIQKANAIEKQIESDDGETYQKMIQRQMDAIKSIDPRLYNTTIRWNMLNNAKIKSMYFGKYENTEKLKQIKEIFEKKLYNKKVYVKGGNTGQSFDTSFTLQSGNIGYYSEEYRGCGNGHYFLALDEKHALYWEDD
jgi:hypothetical protein